MYKPRDTWHEADSDDDVQWMAAEYGIKDWEAVAKDPKNKELLDQKRGPHVLYAGDKVWIPDLKPKVFDAETDKKHEYKLYPPKQLVHLVLEDDDGKAHGNCRYEFWVNGKRYDPPGTSGELRSREDGLVYQLVPLERDVVLRAWLEDPKAKQKYKELEPSPEDEEEFDYISIQLNPAHLDPIDTVEGLQDRLTNLGYELKDVWGTLGHGTRDAIREFQQDVGLTQSGEMDTETRKRLLEQAGS